MSVLFLLGLLQVARADPVPCSLMLWVTDPDPRGLNIRDAPGGSAKVIGALPKATEFTAIGSSNGWIQFREPIAFQPDKGLEWVPIRTGPLTGWVHGSLVTTSLKDRWSDEGQGGHFAVYTEPAETSKRVATWTHGEWWSPANDMPAIKKVLACQGGWLKVDLVDGKESPHTG
ncbi:MAG: SH3 domain-containing protein, partial [Myxococcota bacterium]|nr:SH3 domain-containing protein [Myxococcota bacterium]